MRPRLRVLLIAESCNPDWASVPLVGYNWYKSLRTVADVTLVTQVRNRQALLRHASSSERLEFIDSELLAKPLSSLAQHFGLSRGVGWTTARALMWPAYLYFEHLVYHRFRRSLERGDYDIIHRITPVSPVYPSPLAAWSPVPFILGPINGGVAWPPGTWRVRLAEMEWFSCFRSMYRVLPFVRSTYQKASCIVVGSRGALRTLPPCVRSKAVYLPENGIDPKVFNSGARQEPSCIRPFRILFVGRLVPLKGVDLLLRAVAGSALLRQCTVHIVGDGPSAGSLMRLASDLGIADLVVWAGWQQQDEVAEQYRRSSVFVLPSLREFGGGVVLEAMGCGLPCIVLDHGGPAELVTCDTGISIPLGKPCELVARLRAVLQDLVTHPDRLDAMSRKCTERAVSSFTWKAKAQRMYGIYRNICFQTTVRTRRYQTRALADVPPS